MPNYSYFITIFDSKNIAPYGVYAYGFYIQKEPKVQYPSLYGIGGTQNEWFFLGYIENECVELKLLIDKEQNTLTYWFNSKATTITKKHNISFDGLSIKIASFNKSRQPKILIKYIVVGETNSRDTVDTLLEVFPEKTKGVNIILNISTIQTSISSNASATLTSTLNTSYKPLTTTHHAKTTGVGSEALSYINDWIDRSFVGIALAITISIFAITLLVMRQRKTRKQ